ncbi:TrmH family RNA methyltransferase [Alteromonas sp. S015]|uniref:TrmH family RNA methyltransferase n=1 Tax=Alteromonas sp. S015 TaxID=3117401 RepID=UPI002FE1ECC3
MKLSDVKKLHQKKFRTQFGFYLVEGEHLVLELINVAQHSSSTLGDITLYVTAEYEAWVKERLPTSNAAMKVEGVRVEKVSSQQMQQLSDTKSPQGIIARVPLPNPSLSSQRSQTNISENKSSTEKYIYLYEVQDPGNLGTILRTLAWFGDFTLLLSPNSVDPYNSKVVRSSMGAIFHVNMELNVALESLSERFERFAFLDMNGNNIASNTFGDYQCYLFGNEARGVPVDALSKLNATAYTIAGSGKIDSLNLASAVNICAYELTR